MSFDFSSVWGALTIIGPIILVIAIVWAMRNNRGTAREVQATEEATRRNYDEQEKADKAADER
ncbi:hypothetical protein OKW76_13875 [Sphingomonas sp. S1-29]|uniref:hypothetical protein n=1 Tax=Sphingomonas sp. S1-29 TaxID=2991074 RepID=UPI00223F3259|nr:hypothetical protein [Sphingomonas sp. S1-29]UZK69098.1 hypothetical protein OKW76_13875 [Sphingomonas sp. S1-29]